MRKKDGKRRLAVARLWHEGNSFAPRVTARQEFEAREWSEGDAARRFYRGSATELGAVVDFLEAHAEVEGVFLRAAGAPPGGPVEQGLYESLVAEIVEALARGRWDGVYLSLHGALLAEDEPLADLSLLRRVRQAIGSTPLAVTFDLHANLAPEIGPLVDVLVGYKTYPHVDMAETAAKALTLLARCWANEIRPTCRIAKAGTILASHGMRTDSGPMAAIEEIAASAERTEGALDVTPFGGFAYGDTPAAGASVAVTCDGDAEKAESMARSLAEEIFRRRDDFRVHLPTAEEALERAAEFEGPVAVLEPADNPLSGGAADTPGLLRALLAMPRRGRTVFAFLCDPGLVARAAEAGIGARLTASLGARLERHYGPPIEAEVTVLRLTDGRFVNEGPMERGLAVAMGPTVVLDLEGVDVVVTSSCHPVNDPAWLSLHGIDPARLALFCVKAKNHFRAAFASRFTALIDCDTPGPAGLRLASLPFRRLPDRLREDLDRCADVSP